jgi:myosin-light-chain kinase
MSNHSTLVQDNDILEADNDPPFECRQITINTNKILKDHFEILDFLGRGKFGEVKKCRELSTGRLLAGKFVSILRDQEKKDVLNEIEIMKSLQHPRLLQLYDVYQVSSRQMCLLLELINGGELFERVIDNDFILTEKLCKLYIRQICEGVNFMHQLNILHLDLKPENILCINRNGHRIKIIDFGLARKFDPNQSLRVLFGTPEFVAPEVVTYEKIGYGTDSWSIAVICYVLLSGLSPFMGENDLQTYANIQNVNYDFDDESFESISEDAKDFIRNILVKNLK